MKVEAVVEPRELSLVEKAWTSVAVATVMVVDVEGGALLLVVPGVGVCVLSDKVLPVTGAVGGCVVGTALEGVGKVWVCVAPVSTLVAVDEGMLPLDLYDVVLVSPVK